MTIERSIDIADVVRQALSPYMTAYCVIPAKASTPFVKVTAAGGSEKNKIDTFTVGIEGYAKRDGEACETVRDAAGILKKVAADQTTALRFVRENTKPTSYPDPVRPDLVRYRTTLLITAHKEKKEVLANG